MAKPEPHRARGRRLALVGAGRAGGAVAGGLAAAGWEIAAVAGRDPEGPSVRAAAERFGAAACAPAAAVVDVDLVVIATPDHAIDAIAAAIADAVAPPTLVIHLSGARGVDALDGVGARTGALHPLQSLPDPERGTARLAGSYAAVAGDEEVDELARSMAMLPFRIADADRVGYHAAACIASNHLVALLAQVEACTDVPLAAFLPLAHATLENVGELGVAAALTGPVARGDVATVRAHLAAIPASERDAYVAMARRTAVLAGRADVFDAVLT